MREWGLPALRLVVGRYKPLELIGEGGFGRVWMAEQEEPFRRRVALKFIKLGMDMFIKERRSGAQTLWVKSKSRQQPSELRLP
jgi:serine/threonine protein kinase